jgi:hypothetical protein
MEDAEYDALEDELRQHSPDDPVLKIVGAQVPTDSMLALLSTYDKPIAEIGEVTAACEPESLARFALSVFQEWSDKGSKADDAVAEAGGIEVLAALSLGRRRLAAPPAAFVLYASEWWKHEYSGGQWSWAPVLENLGIVSSQFSPQLRSDFVARGLSFWQLSPLDRGKAFLGAIVINGGIPMRLLAQGDGPASSSTCRHMGHHQQRFGSACAGQARVQS